MSARAANMRALRELLGLDAETATRALDSIVLVTALAGSKLAEHLQLILGRTVTVTTDSPVSPPTLEIVIGSLEPRSRASSLFVEADSAVARIGNERRSSQLVPMHPIFELLTACYASALAIERIVDSGGATRDVEIRFADYLAVDRLLVPVRFARAYLAGAGAVGCGFALAAALLPLEGLLIIADHDDVDDSNPHRQVLYTAAHVGQPKARVAAAWVNDRQGSLRASGEECRLQEVSDRTDGAWLEQLVVAVDSRRARRALLEEMPLHVYDASTTGAEDVVLSFSTAANGYACITCAYPEDRAERAHEQHVAEALGVELEQVRAQHIEPDAAARIAARYPGVEASAIEGLAFDTVFRQLCGAGRLRAAEQSTKTVVAPLAYVSVLAGALLALEFYRRVGRRDVAEPFGSWHVHPARSPVPDLRRMHAARPGCACQKEAFALTVKEVWQR